MKMTQMNTIFVFLNFLTHLFFSLEPSICHKLAINLRKSKFTTAVMKFCPAVKLMWMIINEHKIDVMCLQFPIRKKSIIWCLIDFNEVLRLVVCDLSSITRCKQSAPNAWAILKWSLQESSGLNRKKWKKLSRELIANFNQIFPQTNRHTSMNTLYQ